MEKTEMQSILESKQFKKLVTDRWKVSIMLTIIMLSVYFGFILLIAFKKELLAYKIGEHLTIGLPIGLGVIILAWVLTGLYVRWANTKYDQEVQSIKSQITNLK